MGAPEPIDRQEMMNEALALQIIETFQSPNPKTPEFPVTCIKLNRSYELVRPRSDLPKAAIHLTSFH